MIFKAFSETDSIYLFIYRINELDEDIVLYFRLRYVNIEKKNVDILTEIKYLKYTIHILFNKSL